MLDLESNQAIQSKYRIIKIASPSTVFEPAIGADLIHDEIAGKLRRFRKDFLREPSDLKHFQTKAQPVPDCALFFCSNSLHQPFISVSLKIRPMTRRNRPFRLGFSKLRKDRIASSL